MANIRITEFGPRYFGENYGLFRNFHIKILEGTGIYILRLSIWS
jgi:hypothetical protein